MQRKAFTLIELLVVIAIIAILAAILFPVFAQAKAAAKAAAALSNIKQVGLGLMIYTNDNDDVYPRCNDGNWNQFPLMPWSSDLVLGPYLKNGDIYSSPSDSLPTTQPITAPSVGRNPHGLSFMPNAFADQYYENPWGVANAQGIFSYKDSTYAGGTDANVTTTQPTSPADTIMLIDGAKEWVGGYWGCRWSLTTEGDYCYSYDSYASVLNVLWKIYTLAKAVPADGNAYKAWHKYGTGTNAIFADGHAKNVKAGDLYQAKRWLVNAP
jgi:prepilin-type N-terminal cleavage/methylation domain-containing protein/prepilin-type processing-associated H-X9-DG protein